MDVLKRFILFVFICISFISFVPEMVILSSIYWLLTGKFREPLIIQWLEGNFVLFKNLKT